MRFLRLQPRQAFGLLLLMAICGSALRVSAQEPLLSPESEQVTMIGNISYVSGGIGEDSRQRLSAFAAAFNLRLLMALTSGEYVGDVAVGIVDDKGREVLNAVSEGPIFMANLPPGRYEVSASIGGVIQKRTLAVFAERQSVVHFRWKAPAH
jgi:hypothetical protein